MRFIHIADVHLGAKPDRKRAYGEQREEEIWQTFHRLMEQVKKEQADLLLIAGDLFHDQPLFRDLKEVNYLFEKLGRTQVVLIMGNHDYIQRDSAVLKFHWADNVTCLFGNRMERVFFRSLRTYVYGMSYHNYEEKQPLYDAVYPEEEEGCHILLAHGGDEKHSPLNKAKLANLGFDYIALGHIHKPEVLLPNLAAFCGSLEPIDCNETGKHGYIRGEYLDGEVKIEFVPFAAREYIHLVISSNSGMTEFAMQDKILHEIERYGRRNMYRIILSGYRDPNLTYPIASYEQLGNIVDIQDQTEPEIDIKALLHEHKDDMCGRFIAKLYDEKNSMGEVEKKALLYGIQALLREN